MTYECWNLISPLLPRIFQSTLTPLPNFNYISGKVLSPWYRWPNWGHKVKWFLKATKKSNIKEEIHFKKPHISTFMMMKIGKWLEQQKIRKAHSFFIAYQSFTYIILQKFSSDERPWFFPILDIPYKEVLYTLLYIYHPYFIWGNENLSVSGRGGRISFVYTYVQFEFFLFNQYLHMKNTV